MYLNTLPPGYLYGTWLIEHNISGYTDVVIKNGLTIVDIDHSSFITTEVYYPVTPFSAYPPYNFPYINPNTCNSIMQQ